MYRMARRTFLMIKESQKSAQEPFQDSNGQRGAKKHGGLKSPQHCAPLIKHRMEVCPCTSPPALA